MISSQTWQVASARLTVRWIPQHCLRQCPHRPTHRQHPSFDRFPMDRAYQRRRNALRALHFSASPRSQRQPLGESPNRAHQFVRPLRPTLVRSPCQCPERSLLPEPSAPLKIAPYSIPFVLTEMCRRPSCGMPSAQHVRQRCHTGNASRYGRRLSRMLRPCSSPSPSSPATTRSPSSASCSTSRAGAATPTTCCSRPSAPSGISVNHKHLIEAGFLCQRCHSTAAHGDAVPEGSRTYPIMEQCLICHNNNYTAPDGTVATSRCDLCHAKRGLRRRARLARGDRLEHTPRRRRRALHVQRLPRQEGRLHRVPRRHPHASSRRLALRARQDAPRRRAAGRAGSATTPRSTARRVTRCPCRIPRTSSPAIPRQASALRHRRPASTVTCWPTARRATSSTQPETRAHTACSRASSTRLPAASRRPPPLGSE